MDYQKNDILQEPNLIYLSSFFYPNNGPKPKDVQFTIADVREKHDINNQSTMTTVGFKY